MTLEKDCPTNKHRQGLYAYKYQHFEAGIKYDGHFTLSRRVVDVKHFSLRGCST